MAIDDGELEDTEGMIAVPEAEAATGIVGTIQQRFNDAENGRQLEEQRWLKSYKNYRGIYDSTTQYRNN